LSVSAHAQAEQDMQQQIQQLQRQVIEVQEQAQQKLEALQKETGEQIRLLQEQIARLQKPNGNSAAAPARELAQTSRQGVVPAARAPANSSATFPATSALDKLSVFGDFRLRYEANSADGAVPSWDRWVLRGRLAGRYALNDHLQVGARLATGDADNPRTTDVTLGDFASDLEVSLDQAYLAYTSGNLLLTGGQFAKPFSSTELVWDGDVNPQGFGGYFDFLKHDTWSMRFSGIYFIIDEQILESGSDMLGSQGSLMLKPASDWDLALHLAYYDYDFGPLKLGIPGGARGNTLTPDGTHYLSDYQLLDAFGQLSYAGFGERWKVWLIADYVKNLGAEIAQDTGYEFDLFAGSLKQHGHFLLHYGYARTATDAVMGLFSNDNIAYATNYQMHTFSIDYALQEHMFVGLTNYLYRRLEPDPLSPYDDDWVSRTRMNFYVVF